MKFFDTRKRDYVEWQPPETVRMYVCGITPYDSAHLGHVFTFLTYDLLQRRLEDMGRTVELVRNITDVDEPIYRRAAELGVPYTKLAAEETAEFQAVMQQLNFRSPMHEPLASQYIGQMAAAVKKLLDTDYAYYVDEDVYFDISRDPQFGKVSCFDERLRLGLFKKRGGDPTRLGKRQPMDFLLWRSISDAADPAAWETVLGRGRPGWHIECTVMSKELLGIPFDIHGGGNDLIFPHHECEIAQSRALDGVTPAQYWVHAAPMLYGGEKMSKSLGNLIFAKDLLKDYSPAAIRLSLLHYHYREGGEWIPELLDEVTKFLPKLQTAVEHASKGAAYTLLDTVRGALDDDLDTHTITHAILDFTKSRSGDGSGAESARRALGLLGVSLD